MNNHRTASNLIFFLIQFLAAKENEKCMKIRRKSMENSLHNSFRCKFINILTNKVFWFLLAGRFICSTQRLPRSSSPTHKGDSTAQRTRYDKSRRRNLKRSISRSWLDTRLRSRTADLQILGAHCSTTSLCIHAAYHNNGEWSFLRRRHQSSFETRFAR
jgi:hypothetical protein